MPVWAKEIRQAGVSTGKPGLQRAVKGLEPWQKGAVLVSERKTAMEMYLWGTPSGWKQPPVLRHHPQSLDTMETA